MVTKKIYIEKNCIDESDFASEGNFTTNQKNWLEKPKFSQNSGANKNHRTAFYIMSVKLEQILTAFSNPPKNL